MRRFVLLSFLAGCAYAPEPLAEPSRNLATFHQRAAWLDGLLGASSPTSPNPPSCMLQVQMFAVREVPIARTVADDATVIAATTGDPFRGATSTLQALSRMVDADARQWLQAAARQGPTEVQPLGRTSAVVAPGIATGFEGGAPLPTVLASWLDNRVDLALRDAGELVVLGSGLATSGDVLVLFVPAATRGGPGFALALEREDPADPAAVAAAAAAADADAARRLETPVERTAARQVEIAMAAVGERNRRPALLALAHGHGAARITDVLLSADEAALRAITAGLRPASASPAATDPAAARWDFERAVWQSLLPRFQRDELLPPLRACALRHLGAVAYDPTTFGLLLQASRDEAAFAAALREENLLALGDHDTVPRLRAHDWLVERRAAVPGFDPLAPAAERQLVLRTFLAANSTPEVPR
jgi:hypothetical protein